MSHFCLQCGLQHRPSYLLRQVALADQRRTPQTGPLHQFRRDLNISLSDHHLTHEI